MSQSSKKSDIFFYLFLIIIVGLGIGGTYLAIKYHNANYKPITSEPPKEPVEEEIIPYLVFKEVSESNTIDAFKRYPINPININFTNNEVTISGLKDKSIESKINAKLSILDATKDRNNNNQCYINFNVSNVLSISCKTKTLNLNLVTGNEITIEEIFNKDTDIYSILVSSIYNSICSWIDCTNYNEESEYPNEVENQSVAALKDFKNNNYSFSINDGNIIITYNNIKDYFNSTYISYGEYKDDITIHERFLNNSIYEQEISDYCTPNSCYYKLNQTESDVYNEEEFLNGKTYIHWDISNSTRFDASYKNANEYSNLDLKKISPLIKEEIIKNEKLDTVGNNYLDLTIYVNIYYHTNNDYQIIYSITQNDYSKENFIKYRLGTFYQNIPNISQKRIDRINMLLSTDNKISYLDDNPTKLFNFENKLYDYIMATLTDEDNYDFRSYNNCEFSEDYEKCEQEKDYHNLIKEAVYAIDEVNNRLHMYEVKPGIGMAESFVNVMIPLDIFKEEQTPDNNEQDNEETNNDENTNELN